MIESGTDPALFGAVADKRAMNIGDIFVPPKTEPVYTADDMFKALLGTLMCESGGNIS